MMTGRGKSINRYKLYRFGFLLVVLFLTAVVLLSGAFAPKLESSVQASTTILPGTRVQGVDLSNLTREESLAQLVQLEQQLQQTMVEVNYRDARYHFTLSRLGCAVDAEQTVDQLLVMSENTGFFQRKWADWKPWPKNYQPELSLDREQTKAALQEVAGALYVAAVPAVLKVNDQDEVYVLPSSPGYRADLDVFCQQLMTMAGDDAKKEQVLALELPVVVIPPEVSTEEVNQWAVTEQLAHYTTYFDPKLLGRTNNIKIAADKLDELLIAPEQVVSFNEVVGPRTVDRGYQNAAIIVGNKFEDGLGGGICQVVTTLYNTVLLADLAIVQRGNHNVAITYAPIGLDAAVAYGSLDFQFKNDTKHHLLLKTNVAGNSLTIKLFGHAADKKSVNLNSWVTETIAPPKVIYKIDPSLEPGASKVLQKSALGYRTAAQRVVFANGQEVKREMLPASYYHPMEQVLAVQSEEQIPGPETPEPNPDAVPDEPGDGSGDTPAAPGGMGSADGDAAQPLVETPAQG